MVGLVQRPGIHETLLSQLVNKLLVCTPSLTASRIKVRINAWARRAIVKQRQLTLECCSV